MWSNETGVVHVEMFYMLRPGLANLLPFFFPMKQFENQSGIHRVDGALLSSRHLAPFPSPLLLSLCPAILVPEATVLSAPRSNPFPDLSILLLPFSEQKLYISALCQWYVALSACFFFFF